MERKSVFSNAILAAMKNNELKAFNIIRSIEVNYQNYILGINGGYIAWDPFGELCDSVLDKNRFSSQRRIKALKIRGIESSIEEILD